MSAVNAFVHRLASFPRISADDNSLDDDEETPSVQDDHTFQAEPWSDPQDPLLCRLVSPRDEGSTTHNGGTSSTSTSINKRIVDNNAVNNTIAINSGNAASIDSSTTSTSSTECATSAGSISLEALSQLQFRSILPTDRHVIQGLHEQWFPVKYLDDFYDELCHHGRMTGSGDPLFTSVATIPIPTHLTNNFDGNIRQHYLHLNNSLDCGTSADGNDCIVACFVGAFVKAVVLSGKTRDLLVNNIQRHPRLFYIMTVGTVTGIRHAGIATRLIQQGMEQVEHDKQCGVMYLHVHTENGAAIRMYERLGFYRVQEIPNYYNIDGNLHGCYLYAKYYHGNRGHRAFYKLVLAAWDSVWNRVVQWSSTGTKTSGSAQCPARAFNDKISTDEDDNADEDEFYDCENSFNNKNQ